MLYSTARSSAVMETGGMRKRVHHFRQSFLKRHYCSASTKKCSCVLNEKPEAIFLDIWPFAAWSWMVEACHWKRLQTLLVTCWGRRLDLEALSLDIVFSFLMVFPLAFSTINIIWCRPLGSWKQYQQCETLKTPHFSSETFQNIKSVAGFFFLLSLTHSREWNNL